MVRQFSKLVQANDGSSFIVLVLPQISALAQHSTSIAFRGQKTFSH